MTERTGNPLEMGKVLVEQFSASHQEPPQCLVLDFDATADRVHGHPEGRFFHGYYDSYGLLPLYVFGAEQLLVAYLRPADGDAARQCRAILKLLVTRLRQAWPQLRLIVRADSGFCRWRLMRWCDRNGIGYILGLARSSRPQTLAMPWTQQAQTCGEMTAAAAVVRGVRLGGGDLGPAQAGDRQGRAPRAGRQAAVGGEQPAGQPARAVRGAVLRTR